MAVGEARKQVSRWGNKITQVSWTDGTALDTYYWLDHSFQFSTNINCDDEAHGIKLSTRAEHTSDYAKCQLVSLWEHGVMALPVDTETSQQEVLLKRFQYNWHNPWTNPKWQELDMSAGTTYSSNYDAIPWVVFQDRFWFWTNRPTSGKWYINSVPLAVNGSSHGSSDQDVYLPYDHNNYTDESIEDASDITWIYMSDNITAILNYNNTRLVVAAWQDIWVYYPELDQWAVSGDNYLWVQWWKKVLHFEPWVTIVALTCTFEYLKVRAVDEWWNTKVYYYQGNNNLRSTFVYNIVDLTWVRVLHVYSVNWTDYYVSSIDGSDWLVDFNKMVWATPVKLFTQRAWKTVYDVNNKAPYFVWPVWLDGPYNNGKFYVADAYGVFQFRYNPQWYDKWYLKRELTENTQVYWVCINKEFLYVSDADGCRAMRLYDTWVDGYQDSWILISREFEGNEWWTVTKMLDQIRLNYEMNPMTKYNWKIEVFVSPNNLWRTTDPLWKGLPKDMRNYYSYPISSYDGWFKVMELDQDNAYTRTERTELVNNLWPSWKSAFQFDWQTITYAIKITRYEAPQSATDLQEEAEMATPIVRQIDIIYHCKDKVNYVNGLNNTL